MVPTLSRPNLVRRKLTDQRVDRGSVKVTGQTMTVRIVVPKYLPAPHKRFLYKYEVVDDSSPFRGKVDWAESDLNLEQGHTYVVRMNDVQQNPRIEELIQEVEEDLTPYIDALNALGVPSTAQQVADEVRRTTGLVLTPDSVRRRLDLLSGRGDAARDRLAAKGRPYVYQVTQRENAAKDEH